MKKYLGFFAVLALVATPAMADFSAGTIKLFQDTSNYSYGNGGEFRALPTGLDISGYVLGKTSGAGYFQTFCVESTETFSPGGQYDVVVSTSFVDGSGGSKVVKAGQPIGKDLTTEAAWLYQQFATGNLTGYDYTYGSGRSTSAGALQNAIWAAQGMAVLGSGSGFHTLFTQANTANFGIGNVRVLNLYSGTTLAQDQLYMVPAPAALVLGAIGLGLVGWVKRRLA